MPLSSSILFVIEFNVDCTKVVDLKYILIEGACASCRQTKMDSIQ